MTEPPAPQTLTVEVRPITVEWIELTSASATARKGAALRVGDLVYEWATTTLAGWAGGGLVVVDFESWLTDAKSRFVTIRALRFNRIAPRSRQELRWRLASLHAAYTGAIGGLAGAPSSGADVGAMFADGARRLVEMTPGGLLGAALATSLPSLAVPHDGPIDLATLLETQRDAITGVKPVTYK